MNVPSPTRQALVVQAQTLCRERGASLLYLTLFGSTLYGTEAPGTSDLDVRGIFLPSPDSLFLNDAPKSLHFSTGSNERRNGAADVDIDLWSAQHWLLKLLPAGDTGALDVLFSPSHAACTLYRDPVLDPVFARPLRLMDTVKGRAYAAYSLGQAKKYGIKGSRIGALKAVRHWLQEHAVAAGRLGDHLPALLAACGDDRFCTAATVQGEAALQLCGKLHVGGLRMAEFARRVESDMRRYGGRAEEAERNRGLDFKALSHALRALAQMEELLQTGRIVFPLREREELLAVKQGRHSWAELEPRIVSRLAAVDALREHASYVAEYDADFARGCVLACYGRGPAPLPPTQTDVCAEGFSVPPATRQAILDKLENAERTHEVQVLYACE